MVQSGFSIEEICTKLLDQFDVDEEVLRTDVNELLVKLLEAGLIRVAKV